MGELSEKQQAILDTLIDPDVLQKPRYSWDDNFQRRLLGMLLTDRFFLIQSQSLVKADYFTNEVHNLVCRLLFKHFHKYKTLPERFILMEELRNEVKNKDDAVKLYYISELNSVYEFFVPGLATREVLLDKLTGFAKAQALKVACANSFDLIMKAPDGEETWAKVYEMLRQAMLVDRSFDVGLEYFPNIEEIIERMKRDEAGVERFTSGFESIDNAIAGGGPKRGEIYAWIGRAGRGKTHIKDTPILMFDGSIKKCQDVQVGDLAMGDDSTPRRVLSTHMLVDRVYEIKPVKGDSYYVNSEHILSLKNSWFRPGVRKDRGRRTGNKNYRNPNGSFYNHPSRLGQTDIYNISVDDWFLQTGRFRKSMKGWRVGVDFQKSVVAIDPYILGLWLGDGSSDAPAITNMDISVISAFKDFCILRSLVWKIKHKKHTDCKTYTVCEKTEKSGSFYNDLKFYSLFNNKHIPHIYKINDRETRLALLAGLIDTDGSLHYSGYDIIQKNKALAEDIVFLARSLGFAAYMKSCIKKCQTGASGNYYRIGISGDCSVIPVRVAYKKAAPRKQVKDVLKTGIQVIRTEQFAEFFGFQTDGNHLFLLGDFTVVHNSLALVKAAVQNVLKGHKVLYITMEMDDIGICERFTSQFSLKPINFLYQKKTEIVEHVHDWVKSYDDPNRLIVRQFPGGVMDVNGIRAYCSQVELYGFKPDLLIIDYIGEMRDAPGIPTWQSRYQILRDLRGFSVENNHCTFTCVQPNKTAAELTISEYIDETNIGASYDQFNPLDGFWSINQLDDEKKAKIGRGFVIKHRRGHMRFPFWIEFNYDILDMFEIKEHRWRVKYHDAMGKTVEDLAIDKVKAKPKFGGGAGEEVPAYGEGM